MDFWARLIGSAYTPRKPISRPSANDPTARLSRFRKTYKNVLDLCDRPRDPANEAELLDSLQVHIERLATQLREETRAPVPHTCLNFSSANKIYGAAARAATVSQYEPIIRSSIALFAALVDSEEEGFLASEHFAKTLMRLVRKALEAGNVLVDSDTETSILELLFTIAAKIRLQPEILPVWFQSTTKPELEDVLLKEKKPFVGITQKDDFPLCYLMIDRVHHEGRIGDFARTGLLYVFEATGRSVDLEEWVVSSDLPTLMASGLGALYSQLSRELSILHPETTLPPVLAMSDYTTIHNRATAESAFSDRHQAHMNTFLSYLAFWQDVLDHCRSPDVKQALLDHFQILFLQQLLYPSLLQSSDTDAGSSVAVLTYMTSILEALEYPDLIHMIMTYLLAIQEGATSGIPLAPETPVRPSLPHSPTSVRRRQSLMLLNTPKEPEDAVDPNLFSLADLVINNVGSDNNQTVFAALKLCATIVTRQKRYAFGSVIKVQKGKPDRPTRTTGALEQELEQYSSMARSLHQHYGLEATYARLCEDLRYNIETQTPQRAIVATSTVGEHDVAPAMYVLAEADPLMRAIQTLMRSFFTNSIDVNLALTHVVIAIAQCIEIKLDGWLALRPSEYQFSPEAPAPIKPWQKYLDEEEKDGWTSLRQAGRRPLWTAANAPMLHNELRALEAQLNAVRTNIPNLDNLISGRKIMLEAANLDSPVETTTQGPGTSKTPRNLEPPHARRGHSRNSSKSSTARGFAGNQATDAPSPQSMSSANSRAASQAPPPQAAELPEGGSSSSPPTRSVFQPPPPETPSTTDVLMQVIDLSVAEEEVSEDRSSSAKRSASLNHVLTNVVILQEFVLEITAVLQVRAAVLGETEVCMS